MQTVAIIPARGGSKGIPNKNIILVRHVPLVMWSVWAALKCTSIEAVVVSTDSDEIATKVLKYQRHKPDVKPVRIHTRSAESATDDAASEMCLREAVDWLELNDESVVVFLQATSPIRRPEDLTCAVDLLTSDVADSTFSARVVHGYTWRCVDGKQPIPACKTRMPRQKHTTTTLEETGSFYSFRAGGLRQYDNRLHRRISPVLCDPLHGYQIDEPDDVQFLELLMETTQCW